MKKCLFTAAFALALGGSSMAQSTNPFLSESYGTPYEIAPFEKITIDNYREAFLKGMEEQKQEINAIIRNLAVPDLSLEATQPKRLALWKKNCLHYFLHTAMIFT